MTFVSHTTKGHGRAIRKYASKNILPHRSLFIIHFSIPTYIGVHTLYLALRHL